MSLQRRAEAVMRLYRRLDLHTRSLRALSGLRCPPGCGRCCLSTEVEATVLEMLPAALRLQREGRLETTLASLEVAPASCVLYAEQPRPPEGGHCGLYAHRALICRLFGFAAALDSEGRRELATCRLIRAAQPELASRADRTVREGTILAPIMPNYSMELFGIDPSLGSRRLPINLALAQALEMVGLGSRGRPGWRRSGPAWRRAG